MSDPKLSSRRQFLRGAALAIGALAMAGCGATPTPTPKPAPTATKAPAAPPTAAPTPVPTKAETVTIKWVQWWDAEYGVDVMDSLTNGFTALYPNIKVERVAVPYGSMLETLTTNAQAKEGLYDLLGIERAWMVAIDKLGGVEPLDDFLAKAPATWKDAVADGAALKWLGKTKMYYWYMMAYAWACNMDIFDKEGLKPPTSWNQFTEYACKLRDAATGRYGISLPLGFPAWNLLMFYQRYVQLGGKVMDANGRMAYNNDQGVAALEFYRKLLDSGCVVPGSATEQLAQSREFFATGKIAMIFDGPFIGTVTRQTKKDARVAFPPAWRDVTGGYVWAGSGLAVAGNGKYKQQAWQFMQYLLSEEVTLKMTKVASIPFSSKAAFASLQTSTDPILKEMPAMLNQDPANNFSLPVWPNEVTLREKFTEQTLAYYTGKQTAKQALDTAVSLYNTELDKMK